ncbi:radical SAM protein [Pelagibaculum spongiae]|uniref:Radical SAM protein n=1 Tax=Pelagibaculum spongiae TaxID=2080658 RepID=A0A2V1GVH7_9GAMM|nr:radical SAM protein [Pelagibaculum spongiae]PVZ63913.1 radical SAM protein [Pelagibaculum spongiae]
MMPHYIEPVFRPPSEWKSLILQVTNGCSYNQCTFCDMYTQPQKKFRPKSQADIDQELIALAPQADQISRVFLADGDAMTLSFRRLKEILQAIHRYLPNVNRVSSYCLPRNLLNKTTEQLSELRALGLTLAYVGCESGDDLVLQGIEKGETFDSSLQALSKLKAAGIKSSVMILNGLGGTAYWQQHAINSAKLMNLAQPEYLSTLVVSFPMGEQRFKQGYLDAGHQAFEMPGQQILFKEMQLLLQNLELKRTIFRSDHASNYLVLKGTLGKDKTKLLEQVDQAINGQINLREEWQRGL